MNNNLKNISLNVCLERLGKKVIKNLEENLNMHEKQIRNIGRLRLEDLNQITIKNLEENLNMYESQIQDIENSLRIY